MNRYLLIESRDPFEHGGAVARSLALAASLARSGATVELFLVQNGVLPARRGAAAPGIAELLASGVPVLVDDFSLRERAIDAEELVEGVRSAPVGECVERLASGWRVIWS